MLLDFTLTAKTLNAGTVLRPGLEHVVVLNGRLQHVEVRNKSST